MGTTRPPARVVVYIAEPIFFRSTGTMPTVCELINRMLPQGPNPHRSPEVGPPLDVPWWPPDVFAVTATLVNRSGCYIRPEFTWLDGGAFNGQFVQRCQELGFRWAGPLAKGVPVNGPVTPEEDPSLFDELRLLWTALLRHGGSDVASATKATDWWYAAMQLLAIADEACQGVGFASAPDSAEKRSRLMALVFDENCRSIAGGRVASSALSPETANSFPLPYFPRSLCRMVPPTEACVHPKTRAPRVGFTLRSLSHYLALVPPLGEVQATWQCVSEILNARQESARPLNLLLVPFPYHISEDCFRQAGRTAPDDLAAMPQSHSLQSFFFEPVARWLNDSGGRPVASGELAEFLITLIQESNESLARSRGEATPDREEVHILIMPELALDEELADEVAAHLARETSLEVFITGALSRASSKTAPRNIVKTYMLACKTVMSEQSQTKHHRWKLDYEQVKRYDLTRTLCPPPDTNADPERCVYWERIEITSRHSAFWVLRPGTSVATLICEDLARIDPVQTYIRAIGPSLVVALLMDGCQINTRWPNRYATVLADDPGCSVLTLTSLGLIRRSHEFFRESEEQAVALWRQEGGKSHELNLRPGAHALVLMLETRYETNYTIDGRSDGGRTTVYHFDPARLINVFHTNPPKWLFSCETQTEMKLMGTDAHQSLEAPADDQL